VGICLYPPPDTLFHKDERPLRHLTGEDVVPLFSSGTLLGLVYGEGKSGISDTADK